MDIFKTVDLSGKRHSAIFTSVLALLDKNPKSSITMAQIAEQCGLAKGTLYLSFESKTALFTALREQLILEMLDGPKLILQEQPDHFKALDHLLQHCLSYPLGNNANAFHALFIRDIIMADSWAEGLQKLLQRQLRKGCDKGAFDVADPLHISRLMIGGIWMTWKQLFRLDDQAQQNLIRLTSQSLQRLVVPLQKPQTAQGHKTLDVPSH